MKFGYVVGGQEAGKDVKYQVDQQVIQEDSGVELQLGIVQYLIVIDEVDQGKGKELVQDIVQESQYDIFKYKLCQDVVGMGVKSFMYFDFCGVFYGLVDVQVDEVECGQEDK